MGIFDWSEFWMYWIGPRFADAIDREAGHEGFNNCQNEQCSANPHVFVAAMSLAWGEKILNSSALIPNITPIPIQTKIFLQV